MTRLICGVGVNDSDEKISIGAWRSPYYQRWVDMLKRCYSAAVLSRSPSYVGCSVCDEWLSFSNFKKWMEKQAWSGMELDKDILFPGNKIYSPDTCVFISAKLNTILLDCRSAKGDHPVGVSKPDHRWKKQSYRAWCQGVDGRLYLGSFDTPEAAHAAWQWAKADVLFCATKLIGDERVVVALRKRIGRLVDDALSGRETKNL